MTKLVRIISLVAALPACADALHLKPSTAVKGPTVVSARPSKMRTRRESKENVNLATKVIFPMALLASDPGHLVSAGFANAPGAMPKAPFSSASRYLSKGKDGAATGKYGYGAASGAAGGAGASISWGDGGLALVMPSLLDKPPSMSSLDNASGTG